MENKNRRMIDIANSGFPEGLQTNNTLDPVFKYLYPLQIGETLSQEEFKELEQETDKRIEKMFDFMESLEGASYTESEIKNLNKYPRSKIAGYVMADGKIYNPVIHRRHLPFKVLRSIDCFDWADSNGYLALCALRMLGWNSAKRGVWGYASCLADAVKIMRNVPVRYLTFSNDYNVRRNNPCKENTEFRIAAVDASLPVINDSTLKNLVVGMRHAFKRLNNYMLPSMLYRESDAMEKIKQDPHATVSDRWFVQGIKFGSEEISLETLWHTDINRSEIPVGYFLYLYAITGLWGTIRSLYAGSHAMEEYIPTYAVTQAYVILNKIRYTDVFAYPDLRELGDLYEEMFRTVNTLLSYGDEEALDRYFFVSNQYVKKKDRRSPEFRDYKPRQVACERVTIMNDDGTNRRPAGTGRVVKPTLSDFDRQLGYSDDDLDTNLFE